MTYSLDSQNAPLVSILNEKTDVKLTLLREPKLAEKPFIISDFSPLCNAFYRPINAFSSYLASFPTESTRLVSTVRTYLLFNTAHLPLIDPPCSFASSTPNRLL
jgi:hypothetical protein